MTDEKKQAETQAEKKDVRGRSDASGHEHDIESGEVVEEELVEGAPVRRKGIYLLPNALTTASLFLWLLRDRFRRKRRIRQCRDCDLCIHDPGWA